MSTVAHVHRSRALRSPVVLAAGALLAGNVLIPVVLLVLAATPAWGQARPPALGSSAGATNRHFFGTDGAAGAAGRGAPKAPGAAVKTPSGTSERATNASSTPRPTDSGPSTPAPAPTRPTTGLSTPAPSTAPSPAPAPTRPPARPADAPLAHTTAPPSPIGGFAPDRVPDLGSRPSVANPPSPPNSTRSTGTAVAAGWASFLPGKEFGVKIFAAGLVALVVSIGGLVTIAVRRRQ